VSPPKTAAPIEMLLGGPKEPCVRWGGPDPPWQFWGGKRASHCKVLGHYVVICAKTAKPFEMLFGLWLGWAVGIFVRWGPAVLGDVAMEPICYNWLCGL